MKSAAGIRRSAREGFGWPLYLGAIVIWLGAFLLTPLALGKAGSIPTWMFLGAWAGTVLVFVGLGLDVARRPLGLLRTGGNTYSLARLQMALWTMVVLSALMAVTAARAWGVGGGHISTMLDIDLDQNLLAAMGISYLSGAAAPGLLALKSQSQEGALTRPYSSSLSSKGLYFKGQVVMRSATHPPVLGDLVRGDDAGSAGVVDLSKVQQLLITVLLVSAYFVMLWAFFANGLAHAQPNGRTRLPELSNDMVKLLLLSHGGYLAYKAMPKPSPGAAVEGKAYAAPGASPDLKTALS